MYPSRSRWRNWAIAGWVLKSVLQLLVDIDMTTRIPRAGRLSFQVHCFQWKTRTPGKMLSTLSSPSKRHLRLAKPHSIVLSGILKWHRGRMITALNRTTMLVFRSSWNEIRFELHPPLGLLRRSQTHRPERLLRRPLLIPSVRPSFSCLSISRTCVMHASLSSGALPFPYLHGIHRKRVSLRLASSGSIRLSVTPQSLSLFLMEVPKVPPSPQRTNAERS